MAGVPTSDTETDPHRNRNACEAAGRLRVSIFVNRKGSSSVKRLDLTTTSGYLVADKAGHVVGRVECPMYGRALDIADSLSVRGGLLARRRRVVPAEAIEQIDGGSGVVALRVEREAIRAFL